MYINVGNGILLEDKRIIGIFDLEVTSQSFRVRKYLKQAEDEGRIDYLNIEELPRTFIVYESDITGRRIIMTSQSLNMLKRRIERSTITDKL